MICELCLELSLVNKFDSTLFYTCLSSINVLSISIRNSFWSIFLKSQQKFFEKLLE